VLGALDPVIASRSSYKTKIKLNGREGGGERERERERERWELIILQQ
jgi:hypothetical protein